MDIVESEDIPHFQRRIEVTTMYFLYENQAACWYIAYLIPGGGGAASIDAVVTSLVSVFEKSKELPLRWTRYPAVQSTITRTAMTAAIFPFGRSADIAISL